MMAIAVAMPLPPGLHLYGGLFNPLSHPLVMAGMHQLLCHGDYISRASPLTHRRLQAAAVLMAHALGNNRLQNSLMP